jgi:hypothetical protein
MKFPLFRKNPDLGVAGDGRFVGILLTEARGSFSFKARSVLAGYYRTCSEPACAGRVQHFTHPQGLKRLDRIDLPPGNYRLYVINDAAPAEITLRLKGLSGETRLTPTRTAEVVVREPQVQLSSGPLENIYSAGQTDPLRRPTISWTTLWLSGSPSGMSDLGTCLYKGRPPGDERFAYMPGCVSNGARGNRSFTIAGSTWFRETMSTWWPLEVGEWGQGVYYESSSVVEDAGALNVLVGY